MLLNNKASWFFAILLLSQALLAFTLIALQAQAAPVKPITPSLGVSVKEIAWMGSTMFYKDEWIEYAKDDLKYAFDLYAENSQLLSVTKSAHPDPVQNGEHLTYTLYVTNTSDIDFSATITDTLPTHVTPTGFLTWTPTISASGHVWTETVVVTVEMGYVGPLTNIVQVATAEGARGSDTCVVTAEEAIAGLVVVNNSPTLLGNPTTLSATITAGSKVSYTWSFGDGEVSSGSVVTHTYQAIGDYVAVVTASNSVSVISATSFVTVSDVPIAGLTATSDGPTPLGSPTTLTASVIAGSNVTYTWAFGDGHLGGGEFVSHTYPACGVYGALVTASNAVNFITSTVPVEVISRVYLPLILKRWPPVPYQPTLHSISNLDGDANYTVSWTEQPSRLADTYTLEEATNTAFATDLREVCTTTQQSCEVGNKVAGIYYYRVRGHNNWGYGEYSNVEVVTVSPPDTPSLHAIDNADQDNYYTIMWGEVESASAYILEEAADTSFSDAQVVYQGTDQSWTVPSPGKNPHIYYYRLKARDSRGDSAWSSVQQVVIYPLFVGLQLRWDGEGYIRWASDYYDVGLHEERACNGLTDADTIRVHGYSWYDPNPGGWDSTTWDSYYSVSTGYFRSSSSPSNPTWKWGNPWMLPYDWNFHDGQTFSIDGQPFTVSGPHSGYTAFGRSVKYWQLMNEKKFLYWDGGGDWKQYVHSGDIILQYDAGDTRLLLHYDVLRRTYYKGDRTDDTVQYISNLTSANSFSSSALNTERTEHLGMPVTCPNQAEVPSIWECVRDDREASWVKLVSVPVDLGYTCESRSPSVNLGITLFDFASPISKFNLSK